MNRSVMKFISKHQAGNICLLLAICIAVLILPGQATAISAESEELITPYSMKEWDDGANVAMKASGKGEEYLLSVFADTKGLSEGYYTVFLYDDAVRSASAFDGIRFFIQNTDDTSLKINITLTISAKISVSLLDTSFAILESDETNTSETVTPQYGTISIPARFSGMVYIPLSQLYTPEGEQTQIRRIQSWGIAATLSQGEEVHFSLGNIAFLKHSVEAMQDDHFFVVVSGKESVTIPSVGAITADYYADVTDLYGNAVEQDAIYYLDGGIAGVTLSEDGILEVSSDCVATQLVIHAKLQQAVSIGSFTVHLQKSSAGVAVSEVPTASKIKSILLPAYVKWNQSQRAIQTTFWVLLLIVGSIFISWVTLARQNSIKMKQKLASINQDTEED